jgi:hypothetical protein
MGMAMLRAVASTVAMVAFVVTASTASATPLDDCAQRVIRDWYAGGRVDDVYPLPCYRAAIRALPADVLQYSDADRDIASALAYARQGRRDSARAAAREAPQAERDASRVASAQPKPRRSASTDPPPVLRAPDGPVRLASGPEPAARGSVPYPIIALAGLAGVLLLCATAGWLARRRH